MSAQSDPIKRRTLYVKIFILKAKAYLDDVTDDEFSNLDLLCQASRPDDVEGLLAFDSVLESSKLFLFGPVIEGRHEDHDDDGDEDGNALDPAVVLLLHNTD
jgi:hypothetical protein